MAKVGVALGAEDFGAHHAMAKVACLENLLVIYRLEIAGPTAAGIELVGRVEKRAVPSPAASR